MLIVVTDYFVNVENDVTKIDSDIQNDISVINDSNAQDVIEQQNDSIDHHDENDALRTKRDIFLNDSLEYCQTTHFVDEASFENSRLFAHFVDMHKIQWSKLKHLNNNRILSLIQLLYRAIISTRDEKRRLERDFYRAERKQRKIRAQLDNEMFANDKQRFHQEKKYKILKARYSKRVTVNISMCNICDNNEIDTTLECDHTYCANCLKRWLESTCSHCRETRNHARALLFIWHSYAAFVTLRVEIKCYYYNERYIERACQNACRLWSKTTRGSNSCKYLISSASIFSQWTSTTWDSDRLTRISERGSMISAWLKTFFEEIVSSKAFSMSSQRSCSEIAWLTIFKIQTCLDFEYENSWDSFQFSSSESSIYQELEGLSFHLQTQRRFATCCARCSLHNLSHESVLEIQLSYIFWFDQLYSSLRCERSMHRERFWAPRVCTECSAESRTRRQLCTCAIHVEKSISLHIVAMWKSDIFSRGVNWISVNVTFIHSYITWTKSSSKKIFINFTMFAWLQRTSRSANWFVFSLCFLTTTIVWWGSFRCAIVTLLSLFTCDTMKIA